MMISRIIKNIIILINIPRLVGPLCLLFWRYSSCKDDINIGMAHHGIRGSIVYGFLYLLVFEKSYRNIFYHRIGKCKFLFSIILHELETFKIGYDTKIGRGFLGVHPYATFVNAYSIGDNVCVKNSVTIGVNNGRRPIIGNNVVINVNSVIIGDITIGNNVVIGAGTVLTKSVPDNCVVVGNPAYILKKNGILVRERL